MFWKKFIGQKNWRAHTHIQILICRDAPYYVCNIWKYRFGDFIFHLLEHLEFTQPLNSHLDSNICMYLRICINDMNIFGQKKYCKKCAVLCTCVPVHIASALYEIQPRTKYVSFGNQLLSGHCGQDSILQSFQEPINTPIPSTATVRTVGATWTTRRSGIMRPRGNS